MDETIGKTKAYSYAEADFNGYLPGNVYVATNSNTFRMRVYCLDMVIGGIGPEFVALQQGSVTTPFNAALIHSRSGIGGFE